MKIVRADKRVKVNGLIKERLDCTSGPLQECPACDAWAQVSRGLLRSVRFFFDLNRSICLEVRRELDL